MAPEPQRESNRKWVPLDLIDLDPKLQVRADAQPDKVAEYAKLIGENGHLDPLDIFRREGGRFVLAGGHLRLAAYRLAEKDRAPCVIHDGDNSAALRVAAVTNHHGAPMTAADKRRCAKLMVEDPVHGQKTDQQIARMVGCSPSLIGEVRRGETPKAAKQRRQKAKTVKVSTHSRSAPSRDAKPPHVSQVVERISSIDAWMRAGEIEEDDILSHFSGPHFVAKRVPRNGELVQVEIKGRSGNLKGTLRMIVSEISTGKIVLKEDQEKLLP